MPYREVQRLRQWWIYAIVFAPTVPLWWAVYDQVIQGNPFGDNPAPDWFVVLFWLIFGIVLPVGVFFVSLVVETRDDYVLVRYVPFFQRKLAYRDIVSAEAITFKPLQNYGGWGIRLGRGGTAYTVSGKQGVELTLRNGKR
ncbi:MAG: hypothetical protein GYB65_02935, partial [Chloroflexi bacterium]|nr:hypothetical protein [Chloroflexota bacterium]